MNNIRPNIPDKPVRLLGQVRRHMRDAGYAWKTEKTYIHWVRRFILFHGKQHPAHMSTGHINSFLSSLANERHCSPATQRIALNSLIYLFIKFLVANLEQLDFNRAPPKRRSPTVLTHSEVMRILEHAEGTHRLMLELLYATAKETARQFVFPPSSIEPDPRTGELRRYHLHESSLRKALTRARGAMGILSPLDTP
ncbi:MAG: phage integrase N-terminal SAM-like domain-containing protein [Chromatocurvus sp.]